MSGKGDPSKPDDRSEGAPSTGAPPTDDPAAAARDTEKQLFEYLGQRIDSLDRLAQAMRKRSGASDKAQKPGRAGPLRSLANLLGSASGNSRALAWAQEALSIGGASRWHKRATRRTKSGTDAELERDELQRRSAMRIVRLCSQQGGAILRLGQLAAHRRDLLAPVWTDTLAQLTSAPAVPYSVMAAHLHDIAGDPSDWLDDVDPDPVAITGITQLYTARHRDGRPIWLQLRVPDVSATFATDRPALGKLSRAITEWTDDATMARLVDELGAVIEEELDLAGRIASLEQMAVHLAGHPLEVPTVIAEQCSAEHLVATRIDGPMLIEVGKRNERLVSEWLDGHARLIAAGHFVAEPHASWARVRKDGVVALSPAGLLARIDTDWMAEMFAQGCDVATANLALVKAGFARADDPTELVTAWRRALDPHAHQPAQRRQLLVDAFGQCRAHGHCPTYEGVRLGHALVVLSNWVITLIGDDPAFDPVARVAGYLSGSRN